MAGKLVISGESEPVQTLPHKGKGYENQFLLKLPAHKHIITG